MLALDGDDNKVKIKAILELFQNRSKGESVTHGGNKTSDLLCNEPCKIKTGNVEWMEVSHRIHTAVFMTMNRTTDLWCNEIF